MFILRLCHVFLLATLSLIYCCRSDNKEKEPIPIPPFKIEPFTAVDYIHSSSFDSMGLPSKGDHYLVTGFENHEKNFHQIDSFIWANYSDIDSDLKQFSDYYVSFFRKSEITNNEYIKENERDFIRYSVDRDHLYSYSWKSGGTIFSMNDSHYKYRFECIGPIKRPLGTVK